MYNPKTAALDFEEFSAVDDKGKICGLKTAQLALLLEYLVEHYQAESITETLPYLTVRCKDTVPPPSERPFMIVGLVAVWLVDGIDEYPYDMDLGDMGWSEDNRWIFLEEDLLADLEVLVIPKAKTLSAIMNQFFLEALAISYINHRIIVEFKEINEEEHQKRLNSLPRYIAKTEVALRYHNGPIQGEELNRLKKPDNRVDGTAVGRVMERIGTSNQFLDLNGSASSLLHSDDLRKVNESFWIDGFVTRPQQLASNGKRVLKVDLFGDPSALAEPGTYIELIQGIYSTSAPEINRRPQIREGVCGAAIVRARKDEFLDGEVAGFMHWSDIQSQYRGGRLLRFGDAVDGLIEDGWKVASASKKRKAGAAGLGDDEDPFITKKSPKK